MFHGGFTRLEGRSDFLKSPKSTPPLLDGRLDLLKGPRSTPPLLRVGGSLGNLKPPKVHGGGVHLDGGGSLQSDPRITGEQKGLKAGPPHLWAVPVGPRKSVNPEVVHFTALVRVFSLKPYGFTHYWYCRNRAVTIRSKGP